MGDDNFAGMEPWQKVVVGATLAIVALLLMANILLLQVVSNDDDGKAVVRASKAAEAPLPALPATTNKSSSRELLKELERTKRQLKTPLGQAIGQLQIMSNSTAALDQLPVLLQSLVASMAQFADAAPELTKISKQLRSLNKQFKNSSELAAGLGPVLVDLEKTLQEIQTDTARIRACTEKPSSCP